MKKKVFLTGLLLSALAIGFLSAFAFGFIPTSANHTAPQQHALACAACWTGE